MRFSLVSMPRPLPSSPNSTWNCDQGYPNTNIYECMGKMITYNIPGEFSALFDRNRSESSFGRQISGQPYYQMITYHIVTILSGLCLIQLEELNMQKVIE